VFAYLPHLNVILNALSTTLLITGFLCIRSGRRDLHKRAMISALAVSCLFILSYVTYHFEVGSVSFRGEGMVRTAYLIILGSHTILAMSVPPLAIVTLLRGLRGKFGLHKALARWTLPVWLYVNVTGIIVYILVYQLNPAI
jgi:putative membrane protein